MSAASKSPATAEALIALGDEPYEVLNGELVRRADPGAEHSDAQLGLGAVLRTKYHRSTGGADGPGGWWIHAEVEIELTPINVVRPDLSGWRRELVPERQQLHGRPIRIRPDWVGEVLRLATPRMT